MTEPPVSPQLSRTETQVLRLLVYAHPGSLNIHYLRHRLGVHVGPREEANSLVERGLVARVKVPEGRPEEWRATGAGITCEQRITEERAPRGDRPHVGRYRPRTFDHLCPPGL